MHAHASLSSAASVAGTIGVHLWYQHSHTVDLQQEYFGSHSTYLSCYLLLFQLGEMLLQCLQFLPKGGRLHVSNVTHGACPIHSHA